MSNKMRSIEDFPTNFKITLADRVRAAAGLPAYVRRKRRIEDLEDAITLALKEIWEEAEVEFGAGSPSAEQAFIDRAHGLDLGLLNDLIDRHNRYYPIEANLPIDLCSGRLTVLGKPWEPMAPATHEQFIKRVRALMGGSGA